MYRQRDISRLRNAIGMALATILVVAWLTPSANACTHCADSPAAEVSCCGDPVATPPCACDAHNAAFPLNTNLPDCCPCGFHEAPAEAAVVTAAVQPVVQYCAVLSRVVAMAPLPLQQGRVAVSRAAAFPVRTPAYLLDCALLR
jgi:hypothetical protein